MVKYVDGESEFIYIIYHLLQNYTINYWIELGAPRSKLVLGMAIGLAKARPRCPGKARTRCKTHR